MEKIVVSVEKFKAKDNTIYDTIEECVMHEKRLDGLIKTCTECEGSKKVDPYGDGRVLSTCNTCNGKGYLEKKEVWQ